MRFPSVLPSPARSRSVKSSSPGQFALAEAVQHHGLSAPGETLFGTWNLKQVRRPGDEEPPWPPVLLDGVLHGSDELGRALDFVDHQKVVALADERIWVRTGRVVVGRRVQTHDPGLRACDSARKGALSDLTRALNDGDRGVGQRLFDQCLREPRPQVVVELEASMTGILRL